MQKSSSWSSGDQRPLARLDEADVALINALVDRTLDRAAIAEEVEARFSRKTGARQEESRGC